MDALNPVLFFEAAVESIHGALGLPNDQIRFVVCLLFSLPLGAVFRFLPKNETLRHWYTMCSGAFLGYLVFGPTLFHSALTTIVTWLCMKYLPAKWALLTSVPFVFFYLCTAHIYRLIFDYGSWTMDWSSPQMIVTIKLTSIVWNYYDGVTKSKTLPKEMLPFAITSAPSLLALLGHIYSFFNFLAGPAIEFTEYQRFISGDLHKEFKGTGMPFSLRHFLQCIIFAFFNCGLTMMSDIYVPVTYITTTDFALQPFIYRFSFTWVASILNRCKYYFGWFLAEASCSCCGLSFNGYNAEGEEQWDRCQNVQVLSIETSQSMKQLTASWNIATSRWLRRYVYYRFGLDSQGKSTGWSTFATFAVSAFWHGFYPGYYIMFLTAALYVETSKALRRRLHWTVESNGPFAAYKPIYDAIGSFGISFMVNYFTLPFVLLSFEATWTHFCNVFFSGHIFWIGVYLLLLSPLSNLYIPTKPKIKHA